MSRAFTHIVAGSMIASAALISGTTDARAANLAAAGNLGHFVRSCADVDAAKMTSSGGYIIISYPCQGSSFNENWSLSSGQILGVGTTAPNTPATCMSVSRGSTSAGATIELDACQTGAANQSWAVANGNIVAQQTGYCLDRQRSNATEPLVVEPCNGSSSQAWDTQ